MVMKLYIQNAYDKTSLGIVFGVTQVNVTVAKNREMVSDQFFAYHKITFKIYGNFASKEIQTYNKNSKMVSNQVRNDIIRK